MWPDLKYISYFYVLANKLFICILRGRKYTVNQKTWTFNKREDLWFALIKSKDCCPSFATTKAVIEILCGAERLIQSPSCSGGHAHNITEQLLKSENVLLDVSCILAPPADGNHDDVPVSQCDAVQAFLTGCKCS